MTHLNLPTTEKASVLAQRLRQENFYTERDVIRSPFIPKLSQSGGGATFTSSVEYATYRWDRIAKEVTYRGRIFYTVTVAGTGFCYIELPVLPARFPSEDCGSARIVTGGSQVAAVCRIDTSTQSLIATTDTTNLSLGTTYVNWNITYESAE